MNSDFVDCIHFNNLISELFINIDSDTYDTKHPIFSELANTYQVMCSKLLSWKKEQDANRSTQDLLELLNDYINSSHLNNSIAIPIEELTSNENMDFNNICQNPCSNNSDNKFLTYGELYAKLGELPNININSLNIDSGGIKKIRKMKNKLIPKNKAK